MTEPGPGPPRGPRPSGLTLCTCILLGLGSLILPIWHAAPGARPPATRGGGGPLPHGLPMVCAGLVESAGFHDPRYRRATGLVHDGIDLVCPAGTPVRSTLDGQVVFLGRLWPLGLTVWLQRLGTRVLYAHLERIAPLRLGAWAPPGRLLGWEGATGLTTGPHLHYQVEVDEPLIRAVPPSHWPGHAIDPSPTLGRPVRYAF